MVDAWFQPAWPIRHRRRDRLCGRPVPPTSPSSRRSSNLGVSYQRTTELIKIGDVPHPHRRAGHDGGAPGDLPDPQHPGH